MEPRVGTDRARRDLGHRAGHRGARIYPGPRRRAARSIAIEGPSGVGKSATARALAEVLGAACIPEAYDLLRPAPSLDVDGPAALLDLERRLLAVEVERFRASRRALEDGRAVVLDTGFLGPLTYAAGMARDDGEFRPALIALAEEVGRRIRAGALGLPTIVVYLSLPEATVARRARGSAGTHPARWRARHRRVGRWERELWTGRFPRLAPGRLDIVRADGRPGEVVDRIVRRLSGTAAASAPSVRASLGVVRAFARLPSGPAQARRRAVSAGG